MQIIKKSELKGILVLVGIALVISVGLYLLTHPVIRFYEPLSNKIVFVSDRNGHPNIWVMDPDGSNQKPLTKGAYIDAEPVVSPDGYTIAFVSKRGTPHSQIYCMDSNGEHQHRITNSTGSKSAPRFTADGKNIIFMCSGEVWMVSTHGNRIERLLPTPKEAALARMDGTKSSYVWADISPDGKMIAAIRSLGDTQLAVWLKVGDDIPMPIAQVIPDVGPIELNGEKLSCAWSNDQKLAITLTDNKGTGVLVIADPTNESIEAVDKYEPISYPNWDPQGSALAMEVLKREGPNDYSPTNMRLIDLVNGRPPVSVKHTAVRPKWAPDGNKIVFTDNKDILSLDMETGKITNLTKGKGKNQAPSWAPVVK